MSGTVHGRISPLMTPERASNVLDEIIYARVLECVDLRRLLMVELDLWVALCEQEVASESCARMDARAMINRALARAAADDERYAALAPFGTHCMDCEEEAAEHPARKKRRTS